jgi:hypothetical protein
MLPHRPIPPSRPATLSTLADRVQALEDERDRWQELARHLVGAIEELASLAGTQPAQPAQPARPALRLITGDPDSEARAL